MSEPVRIEVGRGSGAYKVLIGRDLVSRVPDLVARGTRAVGVIHSAAQEAPARRVADALDDAGFRTYALVVPDGERAKTTAVVERCWEELGRAGFTRSDSLVAVGGGATTDLAGFVAATYVRGLPVVHVPTTLLAMVDAAVGGKTGINTASGKNLVGAIHPPAGVVCDLDALDSLPVRDLAAGLAEVVKCGFVRDPAILELVEADERGALDARSDTLRSLVERAVRVKAEVVTEDLHEVLGGTLGREVVNYGHTFGHAVERVEAYAWRHGDAVAVGMVYVAELANLVGWLDDAVVERHRRVLASLGLPTTYGRGRWSELLGAMRVDKKARGDRLRFVALHDVARPAVLEGPEERLLEAAYDRVCA